MDSAVMSCSRAYPVSVQDAYDRVIVAPLEEVFDRRYGPILPIKRTDGPTPWGTSGQQRTVHLVGGGSMRETLTDVERPSHFAYRMDEIAGPLKALLGSVDGEWRFTPAGTGVRITWSWTVQPASAVAARGIPVLARLWRGYGGLALERLEALLVPA